MKNYDIVLFGASSFVGEIMVQYMLSQYGSDEGADENNTVSWAIAGRSEAKLQALNTKFNASIPIITANAQEASELDAMCAQAHVVVSTVGPYALYGEPLIKACVSSGTDYCDLTGEPQWIAKMLARYEDIAKITGARILHSCGFDSIPSDLGVLFTQQQAKTELGQACERIYMRVKAMKGAASGGTVASMMNLVKEATSDPKLRKLLVNPYALCPVDHRFSARQENLKSARYDRYCDSWITPFIMAAINTRIVHRSNALQNNAYGENFIYDEAMMTGKGGKGGIVANGVAVGLGGFMVGAAFPPTRWLMEKTFLPKPGEGPSEQAQLNGFYDLRFFGTTSDGQTLQCKVTGDRDPGYGSTAKMLAETAICLAKKDQNTQTAGGFWTPASALGNPLIARLTQHAGLQFSVV